MKKITFLLIILSGFFAGAQEDAWVYFNAKPDSQYYFDNPLEMLSQRALDRRTAQGIALDIKDIPISQAYIDAVQDSGIEVLAKSKWLNAVHVRGSQQEVNALANLSFVASIDFADNSLDFSGRLAVQQRLQSAHKTLETDVVFSYGTSANQIQMLNGQVLHQQDFTGSGKIIAVLDAGFPGVDNAAPFSRLFDNSQILGGYNFVDRNDFYYSRNNHGTMVLSTMGGYKSGQLVGTAPDASYYLFITENAESETPIEESLWVEAAEMADSLGVDVINTSLGYFEYDNPAYSHTYDQMDGNTTFITRGANIAFTRGMIVVVSAGNSGDTFDPFVAAPGDATNVLTVGAVDAVGNYVSFSSIGPTYDGRVKPDVMAKGLNATVSDTSGNIVTANGTSFSGPIMAGMVASFWQAVPGLTNSEVVQLIKQSAHLYDTPTDLMGYGIPDFAQALEAAQLATGENVADLFRLYPNPVENSLFISLPDGLHQAAIAFYNTLGQQVLKTEVDTQTFSVDLAHLKPGLYFYKIVAANVAQSGKIIKR